MNYQPTEGYMIMRTAAKWAADYKGKPNDKKEIDFRYRWIRDLVNSNAIGWQWYGEGKLIKQVCIEDLKERLDYKSPFSSEAKVEDPLSDVETILSLLQRGYISLEAAKQAIHKVYNGVVV